MGASRAPSSSIAVAIGCHHRLALRANPRWLPPMSRSTILHSSRLIAATLASKPSPHAPRSRCQSSGVAPAEGRLEPLRALAHDHAPALVDGARKPPHGVEKSAHIGLRLGCERMEDRAHAEVRLDERLDLDIT